MASEIFGAMISVRDNVSGVLRQAGGSAKGFRGEVEKAKRELERLERQKLREKEIRIKNSAAYKAIEEVKRRLEPLTKKIVNIVARTERAHEKIKKVTSALGKIKENKIVKFAVKGVAGATKALGKAAIIGGAAAFATVAAAGTVAVKQAVDFQAQMKNVGTLLDGDVNAKLDSMGTELKKVSINTGVATADLTDGLYQVVSAFGESAESVQQLEIASKAAKAGNATTTDSVNLLSAVTKGYGDTSAEAMQKASDLAFMTVKLGQTSFPELASSMGNVIPLASTLKVGQEELFGAMATLTGVTGGTAEVTTQLKATMQSFLSPSSAMSEALKGMGYASGAAALESEDLGSILNKLKDSVNGDEVAFANMFSSVEAKNAVLALTGAQAKNFAEKTAQMGQAAGAAQNAFDTQTSSVSAMAEKIKNAGSVMMTSLGEKALPYISSAMEKLVGKLPEMEATFDAIGENIAPVIESVCQGADKLWNDWKPILAGFGEQFSSVWTQVQPFFTNMMNNFSTIMPYVQPVIEGLVSVITSAIPALAPIFEGFSSIIATVFPVAAQIINDISSKFQSAFGAIGEKTGFIKQIFEVAGPAISEILSTAWNVISPIIDLAISGVGFLAAAFEKAFPLIQSVVEGVWSVIEPIFSGIGDAIGWVAGAVSKAANALGGGKTKKTSASSGDSEAKGGSKTIKVGANATGTTFWRGGYTMVGEHGPELLELPVGSKVQSKQSAQNMVGINKASGVTINIQNMTIREEADINKLAAELIKNIKDADENMD